MRKLVLAILLGTACMAAAAEGPLVLVVRDAPAHGVVVARAAFPGPPQAAKAALRAAAADGKPVPFQWIPRGENTGTVVAKMPGGGDWVLTLHPGVEAATEAALEEGAVRTEHFSLRSDNGAMGGLPSELVFAESGKRFSDFVWNDRVFVREQGSFHLRYDPEARTEVVSAGPLCTVLRTRARYTKPNGEQPASRPEAVYEWYVFHELPLVYVSGTVSQTSPHAWSELHFLELNHPGGSFADWAGGEPAQQGTFGGESKTTVLSEWAALVDGTNAVGMFGAAVRIHDGIGGYGTYLHSTWRPWAELETRLSTWLWLGNAAEPAEAVRSAAKDYLSRAQLTLSTAELRQAIEALREGVAPDAPPRPEAAWRAGLAERQEAAGNFDLAMMLVQGGWPEAWQHYTAGDLRLVLSEVPGGLAVRSLFDLAQGHEFLSVDALPLFSAILQDPETGEKATIAADMGWGEVGIQGTAEGFAVDWSSPAKPELAEIRVRAAAKADAQDHAWRWTLEVEMGASPWSVRNVTFPQLAVAEMGEDGQVLFSRGPGELRKDPWNRAFSFSTFYPNGWGSMQFMAAYAGAGTASGKGLYVAHHDPYGSTKDIAVQSDPSLRSVRFVYTHPAPDMGRPGNGFALSGEAVWQVLRGDWYDAARIYRAWAMAQARWWPELGPEGRADTPLWMRELCVWAQAGGAPANCVPAVSAMAKRLGVPTGYHWYNWHQIPFDNDYPHYFPTKPGFAEGVKTLQQAGVFVMPYINGRLWDTHDKGAEDFEFTSVALPATTKNEKGKPYTETYHSKEKDGSLVRLGVMCPATALWQERVKDIVLRLQEKEGVDGVYIDQIAAASPKLCMDPAHGHPLGGGHWWTEGYWRMLEALRAAMPPGRMLTTECNAEPYVAWMDGYLTWHWQHDGQVPAFPAVYGGALQMFGRAYRGGATQALALQMKAGQQLVFGEQIGWIGPGMVKEGDSAAFFRDVVRLRHKLRRYFYAGEMARPPKLSGPVPEVRGDWQWSGEWWVTTDAVLTGAWRIPAEGKVALLFANVSNEPFTTGVRFDPAEYGIPAGSSQAQVIRPENSAEEQVAPDPSGATPIAFPPRSAFAWEYSPG